MVKVINKETEYANALAEIDRLIDLDPPAGSPKAERLELLAVLVQDYEAKRFPIKPPNPVEAIRFRMEQQGLTQRDLVPYLGSRSKVSEVLARKRPLTLSMIKALHQGLGIPAHVLLQDSDVSLIDDEDIEWSRFPVREMIARGWIQAAAREEPETLIRRFIAHLGSPQNVYALYKKTKVRSGRPIDKYALMAWTLRVLVRATEERFPPYKRGTVNPDFMREVAQLSWSTRGPLLAQEFLEHHRIPLIIEPHLRRTRLDGAAILLEANRPVIGMTLRHDRLDNFWFCLMHELAHVALHLDKPGEGFFDDLDADSGDDPREVEADKYAGEALIPEAVWNTSPARNLRSPDAAQRLAEQLKIHPAIVAGRIRHAWNNYRILNNLVGRGEVRKLFPSSQWEDKE